MPSTRRAFLAIAGASATGLAGCSGLTSDGSTPSTSTDRTSSDTATDTRSPTDPTGTTTGTTAPPTVTVAARDLSDDPASAFVVFPTTLRDLLARAAVGTSPVRRRTGLVFGRPGQPPVLPRVSGEGIRLAGLGGDADGGYRADVQAGVFYEWLLGAEPVAASAVPANATVRSVADLPEARRAVARGAIGGERTTVAPQTAVGEWARTEFVGGYWRTDEGVVRGRERQQTDTAFFSETVWYVLALTPVSVEGEGLEDPPTLHCPEISPTVRDAIASALSAGDWTARVADPPATLVEFARDERPLLTHAAAFDVTVEAG
jgi:hypothetical protein